ncbi:SGNH/GDSL hydrolase family protein [Erythrobacter sp. SG61-1L]|uniref:SGNH/GDSL hydrolase family protein n=1 Tax=Erythrobacter sp. SG61-1L TaxID=1603897 RepID=UPI0006C8F26C|nr:SGNH/GDSL hydrolase family protein [Erythrobacter sp. SG61-1L]
MSSFGFRGLRGLTGFGVGLGRGIFSPERLFSIGHEEGFAIDFETAQMVVEDHTTSANNYRGPVSGKLVITGLLTNGTDGAHFDASNFARLAAASWPYSNTQITIAGEVRFDAATDAGQRTIFGIDPGGNDRLQVIALAGSDDLTASVGFGGSSANVTANNVITAGGWFTYVISSGPTGTFVVVDDVVKTTNATALNANATPPAYNGIGADPFNTVGAINSYPQKGDQRSLIVLNRAISKEVAKAGWPFMLSLSCIGDSLTHGVVADVTQDEAYPALLNDRLERIVHAINAGVQGDSTAEMMNRRTEIIADGTPDIVIIYGGTNDVSTGGTVQASPTPTDTTFAIETGKGSYYKADGWITVGGEQKQILSVSGDTITLASALSGGAPATGTAVAIDTQKNLTELALYAQSKGCSKILIAGNHYWNWTSGGDTVDTELARNATLRTKQQAAASAAGAVYVDLYEWMRQLIIDGIYTQGDNGWHSSSNNQHLNEAGQSILADAFESAMREEGWL